MSGLPFTSRTVAVIADDPPIAGTVLGFAVTATRPTAALPTAILTALFVPVVAAPEDAVMMAVPLLLPARNVTMARPLTSVSASAGWTAPSDVVNVMWVPLCAECRLPRSPGRQSAPDRWPIGQGWRRSG